MRTGALSVAAVLIGISLAACGRSASDRLHELKAECGRDARAWASGYMAELRRTQPNWSWGMNSHYNTGDRVCYAKLWLESESQPGDTSSVLVDVDENRAVGELRQIAATTAQTSPTTLVCTVAGRKCANAQEWNALVKAYLEQ
jgi:hypothetical protein